MVAKGRKRLACQWWWVVNVGFVGRRKIDLIQQNPSLSVCNDAGELI
jgi:hypothetical protein